MPRRTLTSKRTLKRILEWVLDRDVLDAELAQALNKPPATFSRRKEADDFPTFEELEKVGDAFDINPRWLQVEFGYIGEDELRSRPGPFTPFRARKTATRRKT